jgi:hypothetical protein
VSASSQQAALTWSAHDLDDDATCNRCGFDAAEWWHIERMKPREDRTEQPICSAYQQDQKV